MTLKRYFYLFILLIAVVLAAMFVFNKIISDNAKGKIFSATKDIPYNRVGLLLGTSRLTGNGRVNPFYEYRIEAAVQLIKSGKIKFLIISGDNSREDYDEPTSMRSDLIKAGIDSSIIYLDYAGFRTFDSIIRLKEIFDQDSVTIISQQFHNERAIYIAMRLGISAIGFNAKDVGNSAGLQTMIREKFARTKVFLDFWFGKRARFLGQKIKILQ